MDPNDIPATRAPDLPAQLLAFSETRRRLLGGKPIDPEGIEQLMTDEERERTGR